MLTLAEVCLQPVDQKVLYVIADRRSGFSLEFGWPVLLDSPVQNAALSDFQRDYRGEISLTIFCNWSATKHGEHLVGWEHSELFVGRTVTGMRFTNRELDFRLDFDDDLTLFVLTDSEMLSFQYTWRLGNRYWGVGADGVSDSAH